MKTSIYFIVISTISVLVLSACGPAATISPVATNTPLPTATEVAAPTEAPTAVPTVELTATPSVPFPITWTVRETNSADGRTIYMVDDPAVAHAAQEGYERLRDYYTFPNGLKPKEQIAKDAAEFTVDPDRARGMVEKIEGWRSYGGYWIYTPFNQAWRWADTAEFNADGTQVKLVALGESARGYWFDLNAGKITYTQDSTNGKAVVTMIYDEFSGKWKVLNEETTGTDGPVVTVTPSK